MIDGFLQVLRLFSTTKTSRHDIAEILLKVTLKHQKSNKKIFSYVIYWYLTDNTCIISNTNCTYVVPL